MATRTNIGALARARDFERGSLELTTERVAAIDAGWVVREPALPLVWSANHVRITRAVSLHEALELADIHLGDLPYRQLVIEHDETGRLLERSFADAGWEVDRELVMQLVRTPDREVDLGLVIEPRERSVMGLMRRWIGEDETIE